MTTDFSLISGCIIVTQGTSQPVYYVGKRAKFQALADNLTINIQIDAHPSTDIYSVAYTAMQINGQTPSTLSAALTMLNGIFTSTS